MLQLAVPLGLLASSALLAPVLIHLVRRPRRVVRVGSLRFLQGKRRPVHSLRWHAWLLLALRCALLASLALMLAGVRWQPAAPAPAQWLLLVPGTKLDGASRSEWERLRNEGFAFHGLASGFPAGDATAAPSNKDADIWSLLRELDLRLPAGSRAVVFGPTWAAQFRGGRPLLRNVAVSWREVPGEPPARPAAAALHAGLVAAADRAEDARYLRAALAASGATVVTDGTPDWIFQLGAAALPPEWEAQVQRGARLVSDAPDSLQPAEVTRWFDAGGSRIHLRRRVALAAGVPVLRDSAGEPWLNEERRGAGLHWRFAVRFHPDWTDWPLASAFPAWWRAQLIPPPPPELTISPEQAAPGYAPTTARAAPALAGFGRSDLRGWCWLLAAVLLVLERGLSLAARRPAPAT